jgi:DNA-binding MarR family transcriptional regulator
MEIERSATEIAFLLSQLGTHAGELFRERAAELDLTRPQAGVLWVIALQPGMSQQAVADLLGAPPSRLVALVDDLEKRGLVERRRNPADRRHYALHLTAAGEQIMQKLAAASIVHEESMIAPLSATERRQLNGLLTKLAAAHQLRPGIHPGYRNLSASAR